MVQFVPMKALLMHLRKSGWQVPGRKSRPVARLGFKPSGGRQTIPGRFDSYFLPPPKAYALARNDEHAAMRLLL